MDDNQQSTSACLTLIASILQRAALDATSPLPSNNAEGARLFLQPTNKLFVKYCEWLDLEPEWVAPYLHAKIIRHEFVFLINVILDVQKMLYGLIVIPKRITQRVINQRIQREKELMKLAATRMAILELWDDLYVYRYHETYQTKRGALYRALRKYEKRWPFAIWGEVLHG